MSENSSGTRWDFLRRILRRKASISSSSAAVALLCFDGRTLEEYGNVEDVYVQLLLAFVNTYESAVPNIEF